MRRYLALLLVPAALATAQQLKPVSLPAPHTTGGKPLMEALKARQSTREFSTEKLAPQTLSDLLWAAWGINREGGYHTAPSASNHQDIDVYVVWPKAPMSTTPKATRSTRWWPATCASSPGRSPSWPMPR